MSQARRSATRLCPPSFRRGLRLEWLEDRTTPTALFVDDSLIAGTAVADLGGRVTLDRGAIGTLDDGDQVTVGLGETGATTTLTFRTASSTTADAGDSGVAYQTIGAALSAALATSLTDVTVGVAKGTYTEAVAFSNPAVNSLTQLTIDGLTGTAADVVIDPAAGTGVSINTTAAAVTGGVTVSDIRVTGATTGVLAAGIANALTMTNVEVQGNTGTGLDLTGTGAATAALSLNKVTVTGASGQQAVNIDGFATVNLTGASVPFVSGATQSTLAFPAALANATLNVSTGDTATAVTVTGTSVQLAAGGAVIALADLDAVNVTGGTASDTFTITPAATGGPVVTVDGGAGATDVFDVGGSTAGLTVTATAGANGYSGSVTSGTTAAVNFNNVESFADGSTVTGTVFIDADGNGTLDGAEGGFGGATVFLDQDADNVLDAGEVSATTKADGTFSFAGLPAGTYKVRIVTPTGTTLTTGTPADVVVAALGDATTPVNFGLDLAAGGTVAGVLFNDLDADGVRDAGESPLAGATVYIDLDQDGVLDAGEPSATTGVTGAFSLSTTTDDATAQLAALAPAGFDLPPTLPALTLTAGASLTQDLGLRASGATTGGTVTGVVFNDLDADGARDAGEAAVAGVTVFLDLDADGTFDAGEPTDTTDAGGAYTLTAATNGTFTVRATAPAGFDLPPTLPTANLTGGATVTRDLGLRAAGTGTTGGTVTGTVFADTNKNGVQDAGESGVRGVRVFLDLNGDKKLKKGEPSAITDANGNYTLSTTADGDYTVRVVLSPGYLKKGNTAPVDVTLSGGNTVADADFALSTNLPPQATPAQRLAAGFIVGGQAHVRVFGPDGSDDDADDITVFPGLTMRDVRVSVADVTGDGVDDIVVGTGPGVPTQVVILDGTNLQEVARLTPFEGGFTGGVYVAAGDVTGDGINDVIVSPDEGGGPRVLVFRGGAAGAAGNFQQVASFFGIEDPNFRGGARVSVADVNGDGTPDLVVAAGFQGGPRVAVFNGNGVVGGTLTRLFNDFFIFEEGLRNGAFITAGDVDGDGFADVIGGGGPGGGPRVLALSGADLVTGKAGGSKALANFFAGDDSNRGGVRVAAKDLDGDGTVDIVSGSGQSGGGRLTAYNGSDLSERFRFESNADAAGGVFVG